MKIIVCVDDNDGMLFGGRRQSKDRLLREDMLTLTQGSTLWMDEYSFSQFSESSENICVEDNFLSVAGTMDFCFLEKADILPYADRVTGVILYRWNRRYPSNKKFPMKAFSHRWTLVSQKEFSGSSHDTITREVYTL